MTEAHQRQASAQLKRCALQDFSPVKLSMDLYGCPVPMLANFDGHNG